MRLNHDCLAVGLKPILFLAFISASPCLGQQLENPDSLAPYIPSPQLVVDRILEAAQLRPGETLYDLGSGDGRIVITAAQKFKAKAVGVELSYNLVKATEAKVKALGLENDIKIIHNNMLKVDVSSADVVTIYLLTSSNERLKPNLEKYLKPGARVASFEFPIRGWKPARVEKVSVDRRMHNIFVYEIGSEKQ